MRPGLADSSREAKEVLALMAVVMRALESTPLIPSYKRSKCGPTESVDNGSHGRVARAGYRSKGGGIRWSCHECFNRAKLGCNHARDIYYLEYREIYITLDACHMLKVLEYERISRQGMWQRGLPRHTTSNYLPKTF